METSNNIFDLKITGTSRICPRGETAGNQNSAAGKIPVFSCEGGCIKGEIARLAANMVAKEQRFARACHGVLFSAPHSALAQWVKAASKIVIIDGCYMHCHARMAENIISRDRIIRFDGLSLHGKYADIMDSDEVPEPERRKTARELADKVLARLNGTTCTSERKIKTACGA